jgi:hypothetical protein
VPELHLYFQGNLIGVQDAPEAVLDTEHVIVDCVQVH